MTTFLWVIVPYVCLAVFVVGHVWRYRYDKFGWTTRSSQLYEDRLLRIGSPLFHFGMLGVILGHVMGLIVPQSATDAVGLDRHTYHVIALAGGIPAGIAAVAGLAILVYRRRTTGPGLQRDDRQRQGHVPRARDASSSSGIWNTIAGSVFQFGGEYNYREGVSRGSAASSTSSPKPELMAEAPLGFQLHALLAFLLFAMWPFTRLVHVFSAPIGYLTRPYLVYRSKDERPGAARATVPPSGVGRSPSSARSDRAPADPTVPGGPDDRPRRRRAAVARTGSATPARRWTSTRMPWT